MMDWKITATEARVRATDERIIFLLIALPRFSCILVYSSKSIHRLVLVGRCSSKYHSTIVVGTSWSGTRDANLVCDFGNFGGNGSS